MTLSRTTAAAAAVGDYVYVFGGCNSKEVLTSVERYDPRNNKWEKVSELPERRYVLK